MPSTIFWKCAAGSLVRRQALARFAYFQEPGPIPPFKDGAQELLLKQLETLQDHVASAVFAVANIPVRAVCFIADFMTQT